MMDLIRTPIRNLKRNKYRSLITIISISIGVASVILIGNIGKCGSVEINKELSSFGKNSITISSSSGKLSEEDLFEIKDVNHVKMAMPLVMEQGYVVKQGTQESIFLWGVNGTLNEVISLDLIYGRSINNSDIKESGKVCIIDQNMAQKYYKRDNAIGKILKIENGAYIDEYKVVGVAKSDSNLVQNFMSSYIQGLIYIPYTTAQNISGINTFSQIGVEVENGYDADVIGEDITKKLSTVNGYQDNYKVTNISSQKEKINNMLNIVTIVLSIIGSISLFVASMGIMTVMLVSVSERTHEIGIKKSIGAKRKNILLEFLFEAIFLAIIGTLLGVIIGNSITLIGAIILKIQPHIDFNILILTILFSLLSSALFGVYPAFKASMLKPVEALQRVG